MNSVTLFHSMMNYPILATKNLFVVIIRGTVFGYGMNTTCGALNLSAQWLRKGLASDRGLHTDRNI